MPAFAQPGLHELPHGYRLPSVPRAAFSHSSSVGSTFPSQSAYAQGGADLLRLIDAQRARIDAELAWVQGMVEYQQSVANLEAAEGVVP